MEGPDAVGYGPLLMLLLTSLTILLGVTMQFFTVPWAYRKLREKDIPIWIAAILLLFVPCFPLVYTTIYLVRRKTGRYNFVRAWLLTFGIIVIGSALISLPVIFVAG